MDWRTRSPKRTRRYQVVCMQQRDQSREEQEIDLWTHPMIKISHSYRLSSLTSPETISCVNQDKKVR
jgi:hypothetical protein